MNPQQHLRSTVNQDGAIILDSNAGRITTLNSTGAYVWQALERGEDIETIAKDVAEKHGEPLEVVLADIAVFIDALKKQDLIAD